MSWEGPPPSRPPMSVPSSWVPDESKLEGWGHGGERHFGRGAGYHHPSGYGQESDPRDWGGLDLPRPRADFHGGASDYSPSALGQGYTGDDQRRPPHFLAEGRGYYSPGPWTPIQLPPRPATGLSPRAVIALVITISILAVVAMGALGVTISRSYNSGTSYSSGVTVSSFALERAVTRVSGEACDYEKFGTGFFVSPGLVVTNAHVVAGMTSPRISYGSRTAQVTVNGTLVYFDPNDDLAVLRTSAVGTSLYLSTNDPKEGELLFAPGFPLGGELEIKRATYKGSVKLSSESIYGARLPPRRYFLVDSSLEPGNSGGPLVDGRGYVVGVATAVSASQKNLGVVVPYERVLSAVTAAESAFGPVSSGSCYIKE